MPESTERLSAALADRYRIERELGAGGMATVYLADDLKHNRKVAIKILKPELAAVLGAERFVQEITTTAQLQHPHILPLFDSGSADGFLYYVMPYIEGETLRGKLNRETQLGIDEAVKITTEVADALDYAHRHGVVHRDIKPENILLHDGRPMVADFGIALALSAAAGGRMTETGMSLGTPHYMSPEQATADKDITGRSDIYSLASVLYEMLTGNPPHTGSSAQQIIMKIVTEEAQPVTKVRKSVPPNIAAALSKALEKLPADRFESAKAFADALANPTFHTIAGTTGFAGAGGGVARHPAAWRWTAIAASVAAIGAIVFGWWAMHRTPAAPRMQFSVAFPPKQQISPTSTHRIALSRDGSRMVYVGPDPSGGTQLWVRDLNSLAARPLPGTNGAQAPFFSPDGESVGYTTGAPGNLNVVSVRGGTPRTIVTDSVMPWGGSWCGRTIYFSNSASHASSVSDQGGPTTAFSRPGSSDGATEHDWLQCIPGRDIVLAQLWFSDFTNAELGWIDVNTGAVTPLVRAVGGLYLPSGELLYVTANGTMYRARVGVGAPKLGSTPAIVADGVQIEFTSGSAEFSASDNGVLAYLAGGVGTRVVWVDRTGRQTPVDTNWHGTFASAELSPDESRVAVAEYQNGGESVSIKNLPDGPVSRISGLAESASRPAWTPDGRWLAYTMTSGAAADSNTAAPRTAMIRRADGSAAPDTLASHGSVEEVAFLPDGAHFLLRTGSIGGSRDISLGSRADTARRLLVATSADEYAPTPSPDGRWFAYVSTEGGHPEVYVRSILDPGAGRTQISADGGSEPQWARSGREIFYRSTRDAMMAVPVHAVGTSFTAAPPQPLFSTSGMAVDPYHHTYSVSRDGRFLMVNQSPVGGDLILVLNWPAGLTETK